MSYLHPVRLHFAGRFRADVSTVNNDTSHFNDAVFNPDLQKPFSGASDGSNWQPAGTGAWRLLDAKVTRACRADGSAASSSAEDSVVDCAVRESGDRPSAKIVDLDPDQQGVSMIFGLVVRLLDAQGRLLMQGEFEPAAFFDLRANRSPGGGDAGRSAYFQSILQNVEWGDIARSQCLQDLKAATAAGKLSIRFITDGYLMSRQQRGYGRIVGTIGPYIEGEPRTFVAGRHLEVQTDDPPSLEFSQLDCIVDASRRKILIDAGNLLKVDGNGDFIDMGALELSTGDGATAQSLGRITYAGPGNYARTAGIFELPDGRALTDAELATMLKSPLRLTLHPTGGAPTPFATERDDGIYMRAEQFVFRLDPDVTQSTTLFATRYGAPFANATPQALAFPFSLAPTSPLPVVAIDEKTDAKGRVTLTLKGVSPNTPRGFIDGQVYGVVCLLDEAQADPNIVINAERNFISILMFDAATVTADPGWDGVQPIFKQYADLYPRPHGPDPYAPFNGLPPSHPVINLADYDSVAGFARRILAALELPIGHPDHMPVTRDLSGPKRALLRNWLRNVGPDGKPKRTGSPQVAVAAAARAAPAARYAAKSLVQVGRLRHKPPTPA